MYPLIKKVCQLDEQGIYVGQTDADLSPEEADNGALMRFAVGKMAGDLVRISWLQSFKNRQTAGNSSVSYI